MSSKWFLSYCKRPGINVTKNSRVPFWQASQIKLAFVMEQNPHRLCRECKLSARDHENGRGCGEREGIGLRTPEYSDKARKRRVVCIDRQNFDKDWNDLAQYIRGGGFLQWPDLLLRLEDVKTAFTVKGNGSNYIIILTKHAEISIRYSSVTVKFSIDKK